MSTMTEVSVPVDHCRFCGSLLQDTLLDLGSHFLADYGQDERLGMKAPLVLSRCRVCDLVQLRHEVPRKLLYSGAYPYRSGRNRTMREELYQVASRVESEVSLQPHDFVVDIGTNDGTLFDGYKTPNLVKVGFEPTPNMWEEAQSRSDILIPNFFNSQDYWRRTHQSAKAVTAVAMFYDLSDPVTFCHHVREILDPNGVFIIQMNDLYSMVTNMTVDIIGHEHLCYYPINSLSAILHMAGMTLYRVEHIPLNGGTLRAYARSGDRSVEDSVIDQGIEEARVLSPVALAEFASKVPIVFAKIKGRVLDEIRRGGVVYAYSASTRGMTILQGAGLDGTHISGAVEIAPEKIGRKIHGLNIQIVGEEEARDKATAFLVLPYSYRQEIIERERLFLAKGGKLIFPLPQVEVVGG